MRGFKLLILTFALIFACSLDYPEKTQASELAESVPQLSFKNFVHTSVEGNTLIFQLEAQTAQLFNKKKITVLTGVRFIKYDADGNPALEGQADKAIFYSDTENAEIEGNIIFYVYSEKITFYAEELQWDSKQKILASNSGKIVKITKDDGSFIQGSYFLSDGRRRSLSYEGPVYGRYFFDEETKDEEK